MMSSAIARHAAPIVRLLTAAESVSPTVLAAERFVQQKLAREDAAYRTLAQQRVSCAPYSVVEAARLAYEFAENETNNAMDLLLDACRDLRARA